jgi:hypothetical protein
LLFGFAFVFVIALGTAETHKATILKARDNGPELSSPDEERSTEAEALQHFITGTITRPMHMLVTEPIVTCLDIYTALQHWSLERILRRIPMGLQDNI